MRPLQLVSFHEPALYLTLQPPIFRSAIKVAWRNFVRVDADGLCTYIPSSVWWTMAITYLFEEWTTPPENINVAPGAKVGLRHTLKLTFDLKVGSSVFRSPQQCRCPASLAPLFTGCIYWLTC